MGDKNFFSTFLHLRSFFTHPRRPMWVYSIVRRRLSNFSVSASLAVYHRQTMILSFTSRASIHNFPRTRCATRFVMSLNENQQNTSKLSYGKHFLFWFFSIWFSCSYSMFCCSWRTDGEEKSGYKIKLHIVNLLCVSGKELHYLCLPQYIIA